MACAGKLICCMHKRRACFSTSGKTTLRCGDMQEARCSIASPAQAGLRCIWRQRLLRSKPWIARRQRSKPRGTTRRQTRFQISASEADVLDYLPALVEAHRTFDVVVIDPPAFAKSRSALPGAARGYKEINRRALQLLGKGGVLVSCSCSHHMSEAHLLEVIASAALDA